MEEFDKFAKDYDKSLNTILESKVKVSSDYFSLYKIKEVYSFLKTKLEPIEILDFGCGIGKNTVLLNKNFPNAKIYGIDISAKSIDIANNLNLDNCIFQCYDGKKIPFKNKKFDVIFISNVFHHIDHQFHLEIIEELKFKLTERGYLFLFEHNTLNPLTLKIVKECEFDKDAKLLDFWYTRKLFLRTNYSHIKLKFILFIPPSLSYLLFLEKYLSWLPFGGQYYFVSSK